MGGIIAVHRKVAPAPPIESKCGTFPDDQDTTTFVAANPIQYLYVLCTHSVGSLGLTTMSIDMEEDLMVTRSSIESMAKKNPELIQHGKFLFVMPDGTEVSG